jgi:hypothetical protein
MNERLPSVPEGEAGDAAATAEPVERAPSRSEAPTERPSAPDSVEEQAQDGEEREEKKKEKDLSFWEFLKRTYASADPRSLGLFRIALGTLLFVDLVRRIPDIEAHYANTGWLTNHYMLFRPMSSYLFSLYLAASTPGEVKVFFAVHLLVYLLFLIGYRTRLMHVLSLVMLVSINSRNIAVENGGYVVLTLLVTWSMFLPLGKRFSVDALRESFRARREGTELALNDRSAPALAVTPVVSLAVAALILQWTTIYYFNVVHKSGPEWKDGTAVYYFFQQDRMVTWWGGFIRDYVPMWGFKAMTWGALAIESMVTVLLVSPIASHKTRMVAWLLDRLGGAARAVLVRDDDDVLRAHPGRVLAGCGREGVSSAARGDARVQPEEHLRARALPLGKAPRLAREGDVPCQPGHQGAFGQARRRRVHERGGPPRGGALVPDPDFLARGDAPFRQ